MNERTMLLTHARSIAMSAIPMSMAISVKSGHHGLHFIGVEEVGEFLGLVLGQFDLDPFSRSLAHPIGRAIPECAFRFHVCIGLMVSKGHIFVLRDFRLRIELHVGLVQDLVVELNATACLVARYSEFPADVVKSLRNEGRVFRAEALRAVCKVLQILNLFVCCEYHVHIVLYDCLEKRIIFVAVYLALGGVRKVVAVFKVESALALAVLVHTHHIGVQGLALSARE